MQGLLFPRDLWDFTPRNLSASCPTTLLTPSPHLELFFHQTVLSLWLTTLHPYSVFLSLVGSVPILKVQMHSPCPL
jgi:hypothetical protein